MPWEQDWVERWIFEKVIQLPIKRNEPSLERLRFFPFISSQILSALLAKCTTFYISMGCRAYEFPRVSQPPLRNNENINPLFINKKKWKSWNREPFQMNWQLSASDWLTLKNDVWLIGRKDFPLIQFIWLTITKWLAWSRDRLITAILCILIFSAIAALFSCSSTRTSPCEFYGLIVASNMNASSIWMSYSVHSTYDFHYKFSGEGKRSTWMLMWWRNFTVVRTPNRNRTKPNLSPMSWWRENKKNTLFMCVCVAGG